MSKLPIRAKLPNRAMLLLTAIVAGAQLWYWYSVLPEIVPSHFDFAGNVDATGSKIGHLALMGGLQLLFLVGMPLLAKGLSSLPNELINVPNKEYWLAPERREQTLGYSNGILIMIGWVTSWLMIGMTQLTGSVAIGKRDSIAPEVWWMMAVYMTVVLGSCVWMMLKFRVPQNALASE